MGQCVNEWREVEKSIIFKFMSSSDRRARGRADAGNSRRFGCSSTNSRRTSRPGRLFRRDNPRRRSRRRASRRALPTAASSHQLLPVRLRRPSRHARGQSPWTSRATDLRTQASSAGARGTARSSSLRTPSYFEHETHILTSQHWLPYPSFQV